MMHISFAKKALLVLCLLLLGTVAQADLSGELEDPVDGQLDMTRFLKSRYGLLPVPILITEPAVGYGGGAGLFYLHDSFSGEPDVAGGGKAKRSGPPSISGLFGAKTNNSTWFVGGVHFGSWQEDTLRYTGILVSASTNLEYYGTGLVLKNPSDFHSDAIYTSHELRYRLGQSNFFAGGKYMFADSDNSFEVTTTLPVGIPAWDFSDRNASLGAIIAYDSRDNIFTPNRGLQAELQLSKFDENLGGRSDFYSYIISTRSYTPIGEKLVLGLRTEGEAIDGRAPFYLYPFIKMRGIKLLQYQGKKVAVGEAELRWKIYNRWSLIGFVGGGKAYGLTQTKTVTSGGGGFRYILARGFGLHAGLDVARGPDDTAVYIQMGGAWH